MYYVVLEIEIYNLLVLEEWVISNFWIISPWKIKSMNCSNNSWQKVLGHLEVFYFKVIKINIVKTHVKYDYIKLWSRLRQVKTVCRHPRYDVDWRHYYPNFFNNANFYNTGAFSNNHVCCVTFVVMHTRQNMLMCYFHAPN